MKIVTIAPALFPGLAVQALPGTNPRGGDENKFLPPLPGSVRGPCPAINTLANHGYIHRDGKGVLIEDLADALEDVFGLDSETALGVFDLAIAAGLEVEVVDGMTYTNIDSLFNHEGGIESDASMFAVDFFFEEYQPFSEALFGDLSKYCRERNEDAQTCTFQDVIDFQIRRYEDSCANNPEAFDVLSASSRYHTANVLDTQLVFVLQANPPESFDVTLSLDVSELKRLLKTNRLPKNFVPRAELGFGTFNPLDTEVTGLILSQLCLAARRLGQEGCAIPLCDCVAQPEAPWCV